MSAFESPHHGPLSAQSVVQDVSLSGGGVSVGTEPLGSGSLSPLGNGVSAGEGSSSGGRFAPRRPIPPKLYRIGEVVEYSGMSRQTIHNYTTMGLLRESRWTSGGHRLYDESVFERLDRIVELKAAHKSIDDIREYFERLDRSC